MAIQITIIYVYYQICNYYGSIIFLELYQSYSTIIINYSVHYHTNIINNTGRKEIQITGTQEVEIQNKWSTNSKAYI